MARSICIPSPLLTAIESDLSPQGKDQHLDHSSCPSPILSVPVPFPSLLFSHLIAPPPLPLPGLSSDVPEVQRLVGQIAAKAVGAWGDVSSQELSMCLHGEQRAALPCTALYCTALYCTALYCTAVYFTVLHCTVLQCCALYLLVSVLVFYGRFVW